MMLKSSSRKQQRSWQDKRGGEGFGRALGRWAKVLGGPGVKGQGLRVECAANLKERTEKEAARGAREGYWVVGVMLSGWVGRDAAL